MKSFWRSRYCDNQQISTQNYAEARRGQGATREEIQLTCKHIQPYYFKDQKLCQYSKKCSREKNVTNTEKKL